MVYYKTISCVWQDSIHGLIILYSCYVALLYNITSPWISKFRLRTNGVFNFRFTAFLPINLPIYNNFRISRYLLNSKCIISFRRLYVRTSSVTRIPIPICRYWMKMNNNFDNFNLTYIKMDYGRISPTASVRKITYTANLQYEYNIF